MNKKSLIYALSFAFILSMAGVPVLAMENQYQLGQNQSTGTATATFGKNFCTNLTRFTALKETRIAEWDKNLSAKRVERSANMERRRSEREQKLDEIRAKWDEKRAKSYEKIGGKAMTDTQKAALEKFQTAVETAVIARRTAINAALTAFRTGLDQAIADRKADLDAALNTYKLAVKTAEANAKTACSAGIDSSKVRADFQAAVKSAKDEFKADRDDALKVGDELSALNDARKAVFEKATSDFKAAIETAKNELKAIFPLKGAKATSTPAQ